MRYLIGVDDTDNLESRGTGFRARCLGVDLAKAGLARVDGVSRHQLFVHPDIPYTSHNSSLCLDADVVSGGYDDVVALCREFLLRESAEGSDAGLCIAGFDALDGEVIEFGQNAQHTVLNQEQARSLAQRAGVHLEGLTGDHGGIIGALAGVGLRKSGNDGRFVWLKGVRELSGLARAGDLLQTTGVDVIADRDGNPVPPEAIVCVDPWPRAVLLGARAVLLVEKTESDNDGFEWRLLPREEIRRY
ncbi:MAG: hypothetical protein OQK99_05815 [Gammaproteobacteria bacterium]|jgi:hypothetical protein|nr:hypothetical protein [Gammaproteobacteria bacterium]